MQVINIKTFLIILGGLLCFNLVQAQELWKSAENIKSTLSPNEMVAQISDYSTLEVDYEVLSALLAKAPEEFVKKRGKLVHFPMPDGSLKAFQVFDSPIMEQELQDKYPSIRNYKIISTDGSKASGRIGVNYHGFHASIRTVDGQVYIDPYADNQKEYYASYYTSDYGKTMSDVPTCGVSGADQDSYLDEFDFDVTDNIESQEIQSRSWEGDVTLRTYRCAIACTGEWGQAKGGTVEAALSAVNTSLTKINEIFEYEVAIRMILVADNDLLMHMSANSDPYTNSNQGAELIGQNTEAISNIIGFGNFDIGHVYTNACSDVGGIASLASVCGFGKGNGVTCHYSSNIDLISIRVACHEMGHQFAASHSFNNCDEENESTSSGYEPGSGWTIMSYAGGCGPAKNVANGPFPYYHGINLQQMTEFSRNGAGDGCASYVETSNTHPVLELPYVDGFSIPLLTPFRLTGTATDAEGDELTFSWEEFDLGPLTLPGSPILDAPQFVSEVPNSDPERIFPALPKILANQTDNLEVLPFYEKDMTWRLTVRDNNDEAGGQEWKEVQFYATETAGPFLVDYPNTTITFTAGEQYEVLWDVANTDNSVVNCQFVDILISTDAGLTFTKILKSYTANDGAEVITIPSTTTNFARVMVRAADNIFFDISNINSKIVEATEAGFSAVAVPGFQALCLPANAVIDVETDQYLGYDAPLLLEVIEGLPAGATVSFSENPVVPGNTTILTVDADAVTVSGAFDLSIRGISGTDTVYLSSIIEVTSSDYSDLATEFPAAGESSIESVPTFTWVADTDADSYIFELSDNPSFENGDINIYKAGITTNSFEIQEPLLKNNIYFWRISGVNKCGVGFTTALSTFSSEALSCKSYAESAVPINLPSSIATTTNLETVIVSNGQISDVSIRSLKGTHQNFKDLQAKLISPAGTEVTLFTNRCAGATSYNVAFDDISPFDIQCPMLNGTAYKPEGDLTAFNGEDLFGKWILAVTDINAGNGGKVDKYVLEVCSNASLSAPSLVKNNVLKIGPGQTDLINQGRLLVEDEDNDADELQYTLVVTPQEGILRLNGLAMVIGSTFTQDDLDKNRISYQHESSASDPITDSFVFVVDDGEGGWIDLTVFNIEISVINGISELPFKYEVDIYPNPSNGQVNLLINNLGQKVYEVEISDILGRKLNSANYNSNQISLDMESYGAGTYFLRVNIDDSHKVFKLVIQ